MNAAARLMRGGPFGDYVVCETNPATAEARKAWPGVPRFQIPELEVVGQLKEALQDPSEAIRAIFVVKRGADGAIVTKMVVGAPWRPSTA